MQVASISCEFKYLRCEKRCAQKKVKRLRYYATSVNKCYDSLYIQSNFHKSNHQKEQKNFELRKIRVMEITKTYKLVVCKIQNCFKKFDL